MFLKLGKFTGKITFSSYYYYFFILLFHSDNNFAKDLRENWFNADPPIHKPKVAAAYERAALQEITDRVLSLREQQERFPDYLRR